MQELQFPLAKVALLSHFTREEKKTLHLILQACLGRVRWTENCTHVRNAGVTFDNTVASSFSTTSGFLESSKRAAYLSPTHTRTYRRGGERCNQWPEEKVEQDLLDCTVALALGGGSGVHTYDMHRPRQTDLEYILCQCNWVETKSAKDFYCTYAQHLKCLLPAFSGLSGRQAVFSLASDGRFFVSMLRILPKRGKGLIQTAD